MGLSALSRSSRAGVAVGSLSGDSGQLHHDDYVAKMRTFIDGTNLSGHLKQHVEIGVTCSGEHSVLSSVRQSDGAGLCGLCHLVGFAGPFHIW
jgi:hypothetical protein